MKTVTPGFLHKTPKDLSEVFVASAKLQAIWKGLTPLARNEWICFVTIVKKPETRREHIKRLQSDLLAGKRRPCCWPGCPHRRSNAAKWFSKKS
jgi:Bacteriocin-protection, YdeI or OmpD-Associated